ncbi:hypothetical protein SAMN05216388_1009103 [Halorientalis persicus]|uniref:Uncharacterized protein n=1 Tax=Halorientalis persicus TaxID=1367881 RepID=A0A1H8MSF8_9EURY|nr:hypothetical protein [Halorientalis persicus]SEO20190.1 hypothetical protein SAMN05216388_1009103 [Halorientalis persicus]
MTEVRIEADPQEEFEEYLSEVVEGLQDHAATEEISTRGVANSLIVSAVFVDDEPTVALTTSGMPYVHERIWPKDVLRGSDKYPYHTTSSSLREVAVDVLADELDERLS